MLEVWNKSDFEQLLPPKYPFSAISQWLSIHTFHMEPLKNFFICCTNLCSTKTRSFWIAFKKARKSKSLKFITEYLQLNTNYSSMDVIVEIFVEKIRLFSCLTIFIVYKFLGKLFSISIPKKNHCFIFNKYQWYVWLPEFSLAHTQPFSIFSWYAEQKMIDRKRMSYLQKQESFGTQHF